MADYDHEGTQVTRKEAVAEKMFPPRPGGRKRERGRRRPQFAFRPPKDLEDYVLGIEARGYDRTEVLIGLLTVARDAVEGLGQELWLEIQKLATLEGTPPGQILARLSKTELERQRRPRR